jgi:glycosyltransferase involved in cell wall biosynthesis
MANDPDFDLKVFYCSDENVKGHIDRGFGVNVKWDIPMLEGYEYKFLSNNSWKPSIVEGFWGLINFGIIKELKNQKGNFLIVHGWNYFTNIFAILTGKISGLKICIRGDNPYNLEIIKSKKLLLLKKIILGKFLFKFIDYFLFVGIQNKELYKYFNVPDHKLIFTPHAVDNERFRNEYKKYKDKKSDLRKDLKLPVDKIIVLFSGKYIKVKRPLDLLKAFDLLNDDKVALTFLGDGELRSEMEEYIKTHNLKNVYLTGFKNQAEIGKFYAAADIFVLTSISETWGLVVNEAMNFKLPIVLSNQCGCLDDLLREGENGFQYESTNISDLKSKLQDLITNKYLRDNFGEESFRLIEKYSYSAIINSLKSIA